MLLRHKRHGHRAAPLKHRLYPNVPTMLPTHMDMELVLAVIAGDSRTEMPVRGCRGPRRKDEDRRRTRRLSLLQRCAGC